MFGYMTAMATEQYPEVWVSNKTVLGAFLSGLIIEFLMVLYVLKDEEVEVVFKFNGLGDELFMILVTGFLVRKLWGLWSYIVMVPGW